MHFLEYLFGDKIRELINGPNGIYITYGIFFLVILFMFFAIYLRWHLYKKKIIEPAINLWDKLFSPYMIRERDVQAIESSDNTKEIFVVVNHLDYELDDSLEYDKLMVKNINRGVFYYYTLPNTAEMKKEWCRLRAHLLKKGTNQQTICTYLKARFVNKDFISIVIHGLAVYIGKDAYRFRKNQLQTLTVQYSCIYKHSFIVDTSNAASKGTKTIEHVLDLFRTSKSKFKCHENA